MFNTALQIILKSMNSSVRSSQTKLPSVLQVTALRAFSDNYIWVIHSPLNPKNVVVVDPGDAQPVRTALSDRQWQLSGILVTHHHADHIGGVVELTSEFGVPVFGPAREKIPGNARALREGDCVELSALGLRFNVLDVPGHTAGHIAYLGHGALFCGDTLFSGGCGRLFEGTPEQMADSLAKLAALDGATQVYCTHEYTLSNLRFALAVEPDNSALAAYFEACRAKRDLDLLTLPSNIELERNVNPFLRCMTDSVRQAAERHAGHALDSDVAVFTVVRSWKDGFRAAP
jgi:hydroxyacylglutathione hydrolase